MSKYNARKTLYNGILYDSKREAAYAQELDLRVRAKDIVSWSRQFPVELRVNGTLICRHRIDFLVVYPNGDKELVEIKGYATDVWRLKRRLLEATFLSEHPEYRYTVSQ